MKGLGEFFSWATPEATKLIHSEVYSVEVTSCALSGICKKSMSQQIKADFTIPQCVDPRLAVPEGTAVVRSRTYPDGSTWYWGVRKFNWMAGSISKLLLDINKETCSDPESGIHSAMFAVGTYVQGDDIIPWSITRELRPHEIEVTWDTTNFYEDMPLCEWCGAPTYISIKCVNGAAQEGPCKAPPSFRIDGTAPKCRAGIAMVGSGRYREYQATTTSLEVHGFVGSLHDRETGIHSVEYVLIDVTTGEVTPLPSMFHYGLPRDLTGKKMQTQVVRGLEMKHGHSYIVNGTAMNSVMMVGKPCGTSHTTIDLTPPVGGQVYIVFSDEAGLEDEPVATLFQYSTMVVRVAARNFSEDVSGLYGMYVSVIRSDAMPIAQEVHCLECGRSYFNASLALSVSAST